MTVPEHADPVLHQSDMDALVDRIEVAILTKKKLLVTGLLVLVAVVGASLFVLHGQIQAQNRDKKTLAALALDTRNRALPCDQVKALDKINGSNLQATNIDCLVQTELAVRSAARNKVQDQNNIKFNRLYTVVCFVATRFDGSILAEASNILGCPEVITAANQPGGILNPTAAPTPSGSPVAPTVPRTTAPSSAHPSPTPSTSPRPTPSPSPSPTPTPPAPVQICISVARLISAC